MSERWRQQVTFTTAGPATGQLRLVGAEATRSPLQFSRTNAFRALAENETPINRWALRLREEWIETQANLWAAGIAIANGGTYEIAEATSDPQLFDFAGVGSVDGLQVALDSCALTEWQIGIDARNIVTSETTWAARRLRSIADAPAIYAVPTPAVSPCVCRVLIDDIETTCFGLQLALARDIQPGQFDEAGAANAWVGIAAPTITGKTTLRLSSALNSLALRSLFIAKLAVEIDGWTITLPTTVMASSRRVMVDGELYAHEIDFAARQSGGGSGGRLALITP